MEVNFFKYQGTGNDFVILDNRKAEYDGLTNAQVRLLCDRRFGVGADGLMLLNPHPKYDFEMIYYNADGNKASMCGNGGRCLVKFAYNAGIIKTAYHFLAVDGEHEAEVENNGIVCLRMKDVTHIEEYRGDHILNTGSPHYVKAVRSVADFEVVQQGREIRNSPLFQKDGINVNFVEQKNEDQIIVRTYERGVEDETYSCGTGVTASALVNYHNEIGFNEVTVITKGGRLSVEFERVNENNYSNIWLCGPAEFVFDGIISIS